eukprot:2019792-Rhodomonas_salina.1
MCIRDRCEREESVRASARDAVLLRYAPTHPLRIARYSRLYRGSMPLCSRYAVPGTARGYGARGMGRGYGARVWGWGMGRGGYAHHGSDRAEGRYHSEQRRLVAAYPISVPHMA